MLNGHGENRLYGFDDNDVLNGLSGNDLLDGGRDNAFAIPATQDPKHAAEIRHYFDLQQRVMGRFRAAGFVAACGIGFQAFASGFLQRRASA